MIAYIIKLILCSAVFFAAYRFLFQNEKMLRFNRFYLLASLAFSFLIPLISFNFTDTDLNRFEKNIVQALPYHNIVQPIDNEDIYIQAEDINYEQTTTKERITIKNVALYTSIIIYLIITSILLLHFLINLIAIVLKAKRNECIIYNNTNLVLTNDNLVPHSFLSYIFLNKSDYGNGLIEKEILLHEITHIRQKHSLDVIFIQLLYTFFWFNPFVSLYKKAILLNHEFLADESVINKYDNTIDYQYLLIGKTNKARGSRLASQFNYSITKKRLIMMTKTKSPIKAVCKQVFVIPLFILSVVVFSNKLIAQIDNQNKTEADIEQAEPKKKLIIEDIYFDYGKAILKPESLEHLKELSDFLKRNFSYQIKIESHTDGRGTHKINDQLSKQRAKTAADYIISQGVENSRVSWEGYGKRKPLIENAKTQEEHQKNNRTIYLITIIDDESPIFFPDSNNEIPSSENGASQEELAHYNQIVNKYKVVRENLATIRMQDITISDEEKLKEIFFKMSKEQQNEQNITFSRQPVLEKMTPDSQEFEKWKDSNNYELWIDGNKIKNTKLNAYKNTDFSCLTKKRITTMAKTYGIVMYKIDLMTNKYYNRYLKENDKNPTYNKVFNITENMFN